MSFRSGEVVVQWDGIGCVPDSGSGERAQEDLRGTEELERRADLSGISSWRGNGSGWMGCVDHGRGNEQESSVRIRQRIFFGHDFPGRGMGNHVRKKSF